MGIFYEELVEKKKIASGARHNTHGGRGKKCSLRYDSLTDKQRNGLNGQVKVYHMKSPMKWAEFTDMPDDLKKEYIHGLINRYNVTNTCLADMFGVSISLVSQKLNDLGIYRKRGGASRMNDEQSAAWEAFKVIK